MTGDMAPRDRYYEQANPDLLYRIPVTASVVLEVGCGAGALGREFKRINPTTIYIGVELMPGPASQAREVLDYVIEGDISLQPLTTLPGNIQQVDCLVFGDVLEHLVDPAAVLRQLLPWLKDDGQLLACIPNVQHWSVLANLLSGQWPQEDQGLFDRTHLRWFTKQSIRSLFEEVGLQIQSITPRVFGEEKAQSFVKALEPALTNLKLNPQTVLEGTAPLQYVANATKKTVPTLQIDGIMLKPQAGMNDVRMIQPLRSVSSLTGVKSRLSSNGFHLAPADEQKPKILIWQRQLLTYANSINQLRNSLQAGYILISEFDDDPDHWPAIAENKNLNFTAMHAVQTSTEPLAKQLSAINPEVAVFENCLERIPELDPNKWNGAGRLKPLRIFFGALNRQASWREWIVPLNNALSLAPEKWEIEVIHDREFFQALKINNKRFTPTCNYRTYLEILKDSHIALLPLEDTTFNNKKSDLKFVEAAGCKAAVIASPTVYSQSIIHGQTGYICDQSNKLIATLESWGNHPKQAEEIANAAHLWFLENRLQYSQSQRRLEWYKSLWERRDELTSALISRVPQLAS